MEYVIFTAEKPRSTRITDRARLGQQMILRPERVFHQLIPEICLRGLGFDLSDCRWGEPAVQGGCCRRNEKNATIH
jgi:hypothetical protein